MITLYQLLFWSWYPVFKSSTTTWESPSWKREQQVFEDISAKILLIFSNLLSTDLLKFRKISISFWKVISQDIEYLLRSSITGFFSFLVVRDWSKRYFGVSWLSEINDSFRLYDQGAKGSFVKNHLECHQQSLDHWWGSCSNLTWFICTVYKFYNSFTNHNIEHVPSSDLHRCAKILSKNALILVTLLM